MKLKVPAILVYSIALLLSQIGCVAAAHAQSYGASLGSDGLANTPLGPSGCMISYRFLAKHSGVLQQIRIYLIPDHIGYAAGTGGTINVTLHTDDGTSPVAMQVAAVRMFALPTMSLVTWSFGLLSLAAI